MGDGARAIAEALTTNKTLTSLSVDRMFCCVESYGIWHSITGPKDGEVSTPSDAYEAIGKMIERNKEFIQQQQQLKVDVGPNGMYVTDNPLRQVRCQFERSWWSCHCTSNNSLTSYNLIWYAIASNRLVDDVETLARTVVISSLLFCLRNTFFVVNSWPNPSLGKVSSR